MSISTYQLNIGTPSHDDFEVIGKVHNSAFSDSQMYGSFSKGVDPVIWRRWIWDTAAKGIAEGSGAVLV